MNVGRTIGPTNVFNSLLDPVDLAAAFQKAVPDLGGDVEQLVVVHGSLPYKKNWRRNGSAPEKGEGPAIATNKDYNNGMRAPSPMVVVLQ